MHLAGPPPRGRKLNSFAGPPPRGRKLVLRPDLVHERWWTGAARRAARPQEKWPARPLRLTHLFAVQQLRGSFLCPTVLTGKQSRYKTKQPRERHCAATLVVETSGTQTIIGLASALCSGFGCQNFQVPNIHWSKVVTLCSSFWLSNFQWWNCMHGQLVVASLMKLPWNDWRAE